MNYVHTEHKTAPVGVLFIIQLQCVNLLFSFFVHSFCTVAFCNISKLNGIAESKLLSVCVLCVCVQIRFDCLVLDFSCSAIVTFTVSHKQWVNERSLLLVLYRFDVFAKVTSLHMRWVSLL